MSIVIRYEADRDGRVYAEYDDGEVLPTGLTLPSLASRTHITRAEVIEASPWAAVPPNKETE